MKILGKIKAYKRLVRINDTKNEREYLEEVIYQALRSRGDLTKEQRATALKNVVERYRKENEKELTVAATEFHNAEKAADILKLINLFTL